MSSRRFMIGLQSVPEWAQMKGGRGVSNTIGYCADILLDPKCHSSLSDP